MRIKVFNIEYTYDPIMMKTSERAGMYSIRFYECGKNYMPEFWGHLNKRQAQKMINELKQFLENKE